MIFLTFKDVKIDTWEDTFTTILDILAKKFRRYKELLTGDKCAEYSKKLQKAGRQKSQRDGVGVDVAGFVSYTAQALCLYASREHSQ